MKYYTPIIPFVNISLNSPCSMSVNDKNKAMVTMVNHVS